MPATNQDAGACQCAAPAGCLATFRVIGCGARGLPGATVSVAGGGSGTTDANGRVTLDVGSTGAKSVTVTADRFDTLTVSRTVNPCGTSVPDITPTPAAGYHCMNQCAVPLAETLHTDRGAPWDLLLWVGGQWSTPDFRYNLLQSGGMTFDPGVCGTGTGLFNTTTCPPAFLGIMQCGPTLGFAGTVTE